MKKILLVTHGKFCEGIKDSLRVIISDNSMVDTLSVDLSDSPEHIHDLLQQYVDRVDQEALLFILTDIPAGSTTISSAPFLQQRENIHLISGMNLGMLLAFALQEVEEGDVKENIQSILEEAKSTIVYVNEMLQAM